MPSQELDYEAIRKRAEKRVKNRIGIYIHLAVFIAVNAFLWSMWIIKGSLGFPWPLMVTLGWGIGLVAHGLVVYLESGPMDRMRDRAIQHEIEAEKRRLGIIDDGESDEDVVLQRVKRKNNERVLRVGDDGELVDVDQAESDQAKRNSRSLN